MRVRVSPRVPILSYGVIGNTSDFGSEELRFESLWDNIFINEMKKQVKTKTEQTALINTLAKLQEKYEQVQSKTLNDAITHLQAAIRSLNGV